MVGTILLPHNLVTHSQYAKSTRNIRAPTAWTFSNVIAGSDSTGVVLKTTMFNLCAQPSTMQRLHDELTSVERTHALTRPFPTWAEVRDLPYLDACINEGVRLHPPFCLPLERVVPGEGLTINGHAFAGGTVVGMSPWVVNRHRPTFGDDADAWRPERWLGLNAEQYKRLENSMLTVSHRQYIRQTLATALGLMQCVVWSGQTHLFGQERSITRDEEAGLGTSPKLQGMCLLLSLSLA